MMIFEIMKQFLNINLLHLAYNYLIYNKILIIFFYFYFKCFFDVFLIINFMIIDLRKINTYNHRIIKTYTKIIK